MASLYHGAAAFSDEGDGSSNRSDQPDPSEEVPWPDFQEARRRRDDRTVRAASQQSMPVSGSDRAAGRSDSRVQSEESVAGVNTTSQRLRSADSRQHVNFEEMSPSERSQSDDPWQMPQNDPWRSTRYHEAAVAENWSDNWSSDGRSGYGEEPNVWDNWSEQSWSDRQSNFSWSEQDRHSNAYRHYDNWDNRSDGSYHSGRGGAAFSSRSNSNYSDDYRYIGYGGQGDGAGGRERDPAGQEHRWEDQGGHDQTDRRVPATRRWYNWENWDEQEDGMVTPSQENSRGVELQSPASPQAWQNNDPQNKPSGQVPSGNPSIAGNSHGNANATTGKLSSSHPPIFYARPGESWEEYWRSVSFWIASEGRALPAEMRGPRMTQQLRERAAKIVQHLSVEEVSGADGIDVIKKTIEASPIIKILDQKKVDRRRQKFLRLQRLPHESIESFLNRAEIYRRENQASPEYQVGAKFYIGHLLDAARFTKRDLALIKAASGGSLDDEDAVTTSMIDLADQLEGQAGCPIGRGEPMLDHEDKYLVQKPTTSSTSSTASSNGEAGGMARPFARKRNFRRFPKRKVRDALMAIMEDDDGEEVGEEADFLQMALAENLGEDSMDEEEEDGMNSFAPPTAAAAAGQSHGGEQAVYVTSPAQSGAAGDGQSPAMMEIYAQEYKARQRVREIKKMRQYFQKGQGKGHGRPRDPAAQRWIEEQQKTEPCFLCHKLGHWSQECPYRQQKNPTHATNVTFPVGPTSGSEWDLLQTMVSGEGAYMPQCGEEPRSSYRSILTVNSTPMPNEVCWSMDEMGTKMILDLGCMKTVAGTDWVNPIVKTFKENGRYCKVTPEKESFRFGDGHLTHSKFSVLMEVSLATIPCILRVSVVAGNCPPLLSKHVATSLGFIIDTEAHTLISKKYHVDTYGLQQSSTGTQLGGHYILSILDFDRNVSIPSDLSVPAHVEVFPLVPAGVPKGVRSNSRAPRDRNLSTADGAAAEEDCTSGVQHRLKRGELTMGGRGQGRYGRSGQLGSGGKGTRRQEESEVPVTEDEGNVVDRVEGTNNDLFDAYTGANVDDVGDDEATRTAAGTSRGHRRQEEQGQAAEDEGEVEQSGREGGIDRQPGRLPDPVYRVQQRRDLQHHEQSQEPRDRLQVEDPIVDAPGEECGGGPASSPKTPLEEKSKVGDAHARPALGSSMGALGISQTAMLESKNVLAGHHGDGGGKGVQQEGVLTPSDPNAPTIREQQRRFGE